MRELKLWEKIYYPVYRFWDKYNPKQLIREVTYAKQRIARGWSDRDTWGAGERIAKITAEMLQHLNDHAYTDWPEWFELNVQEKDGYKDLQSVIDDINNYLKFTETSWADGLESVEEVGRVFEKDEKTGNIIYKSPGWTENGKKLTEKQLTDRIENWHKEERVVFDKASNALQFFGRHFGSFWD